MFYRTCFFLSGNGAITSNEITLQSPNFGSNQFTLVAETRGGPPTSVIWRRNGGAIGTQNTDSISTVPDPDNNQNDRLNCRYRSTLVVTGMLPGRYEYLPTNRVTSNIARTFIIEGMVMISRCMACIMRINLITGGDPTNLVVSLIGNSTVRVSWTEPTGPPSGGYRITDAENGLDRPAPSSPQEFMLTPGDYSIRVLYDSLHFPGGSVGPRAIRVLGEGVCVIGRKF